MWELREDNTMDDAPLILNDSTEDDRNDEQPRKEQMTPFAYVLTFMSAIGGFLFGYDTGIVSGAMILLADSFKLTSVWKELIVSSTILFAAIAALVGGGLNTWLGRKPVILSASLVFTLGAVILGLAVNKEMLLIGRAIVGIGIGFASMTVPMYIAECAPCHLRGRLVILNNAFITMGQLIAGIIAGIFSYDKKHGWRYMLGFAGIPSVIQFIGFLFLYESPRWLVGNGNEAKARFVLKKIRGTDIVGEELNDIITTCQEDNQQQTGGSNVLLVMLRTPHVRRALFVGCMLQCFQQISGINTVMYYSATIIHLSGVRDESSAIWLASITAAVNFIFTFVGMWLVEKIGRRPLTLGSLIGSTLSLSILAIGFQLAAAHSPPVNYQEFSNTSQQIKCANYSWCDPCMMNRECGFCYDGINGSCLAVYHDSNGDPDPSRSMNGRCSVQSENPFYAYDYCPTNAAWMATFGLVLYLMFFAPGMGPMPWTVNSEIYPLWARSMGNSLATLVNWLFNLAISMTFLTLTEVLTRYGAFWLYSGFAFIGCIFVYKFLPETKGKKLEEVEHLFKTPFC